jgi:hypothetical protein
MRKKWPRFSFPEFRINDDKYIFNLQRALTIELTAGAEKTEYLQEDDSLIPDAEGVIQFAEL